MDEKISIKGPIIGIIALLLVIALLKPLKRLTHGAEDVEPETPFQNTEQIEIKEAFRTKAKIYHPDVSDDPEAAELFIKLTEAYQYAIQKNEFINRIRNHISQKESFENRWKAQQRKKAQEYARRHAKMKYSILLFR